MGWEVGSVIDFGVVLVLGPCFLFGPPLTLHHAVDIIFKLLSGLV